jgi:hypothetical protein
MAIGVNSSITIIRPFGVCPACEREIDAETVVSFDGGQMVLGGGTQTVNLNGRVTGIKMQHDCIPKATRGRGRPPGTKNKPKVDVPPEAFSSNQVDERSKAEAHRDRLREHEATTGVTAE